MYTVYIMYHPYTNPRCSRQSPASGLWARSKTSRLHRPRASPAMFSCDQRLGYLESTVDGNQW